MPLKLKDNGEDEAEDKQNHGPILHQPGIQPHISHSLIITVILIVLLAVAGYAIYKSGVWKNLRTNGAQQAPQTAVQVPAAEPAPAPSPDTLRTAAGSVEQPASPAAQEAVSGGGYTIFVSRQKERARADEETARWKNAGYTAEVVEREGWYCVAVGRYGTREEARSVAEKLKEGLEGGYWISSRP